MNFSEKDKDHTITLKCTLLKRKKTQMNKETRSSRNGYINTENKLVLSEDRGLGEMGKMGEWEWEVQASGYRLNK